jgi:PAS domain S-box-containing protein
MADDPHPNTAPGPNKIGSERLERMFAQVPSIMAMVRGPDHIFELVNDQAMDFVGRRDLIGTPFRDALPEMEAQGFSDLLDTVYRTGEPFVGHSVPVVVHSAAGDAEKQRFVDFIYQPVLGKNGAVEGIFIQGTDVTARHRAEELLRAQTRVMELVMQGAPVEQALGELMTTVEAHSAAGMRGSILILDEDGKRLLHGAAPSLPDDYCSAIDGVEIGPCVGSCGTAAFTQKPVFVSDISTDPLWADFRDLAAEHGLGACWSIPIFSGTGKLLGTFALYYGKPKQPTSEDLELVDMVTRSAALIIERKAIEEQLRDRSEDFSSLADNIPALAWMARADGHIFWYNRRWFEYTGRTAEDQAGWGWETVHDPEMLPLVVESWRHSLATGEPFEMTFPLKGADGRFRPFLTRVTPIRDEAGEIIRWFGTNIDVSEQYDAMAALQESETRLRTLFEHAGVGMVEIDSEWRILKSNRAYSDISGRSEEELRGLSSLAFTHPDDIELSESNLKRVDSGAVERVKFEKRYVQPDGRIIWVRSNVARIADGQADHRFLKVVEDITGEKEAFQLASEKSQQLETLNRVGSALSAELDLETVVQMVTDAGVKITGADFGAFFYNVINNSGESYMLYTLSGADRSQFDKFGMPRNTKIFAPTFSGVRVVRSDNITKDPRYGKNPPNKGMPKGHLPVVSYLAVPVKGRAGNVIGGLFFGHHLEAQFTDQHESLMVGIAAQAAIAMDNANLYRDAQREIENRMKAEQAVRLLNENLEFRVAEEIERRSQSEEALRQLQKMETVGQLTGGIAHDFNNLLQIVSGNLDIVRRNLPADSARLRRSVDNAMKGADRAAILTQRLLAFSRRQPLAPKVLDPNKLVSGMSEMLHRTLGETYSIETVLASGLWRIEADPNQLESALLNLAVNARDAMPEGGKLTIETANTHLDRRYAEVNSGALPGQYVVICVTDTGEGMDRETAEKAFEPFFTTKGVGKGTGLGLSMVYGFVKQSGGHIKIYSEPGEGTTVKIYLPRYLGGSAEAVADEAEVQAPEGDPNATILVCEDDEDVRALSADSLRGLGYAVIEAADGESALRMLQGDLPVDLLFTDVVLPGMTGATLAKEARALRPELKVLFTTGYARNAIVHQGRLDPGVELISKPFSYSDLAIRIRDLLDAPAPK